MEDNSHPPLGLAPVTDTPAEGAEPSSESGQTAASEETVHPEGDSNTEGDGSKKEEGADGGTTTDPEPEPFHKEGEKIFKTKEEYIAHVNQQRGAASRLAHEKKLAEESAQHYEKLYKAALAAVGQPAGTPATEPEMSEESKAAIESLKKAGFLTTEQAKAMVEDALKPFKADSEQRFQEKVAEARQTVDAFIGLNPDAADHAVDLEQTLLKMEKAGIPGGLEHAYFLVTGKVAKTEAAAVNETKREVKKVQAAQAGGAPAGKSGGAPKDKDIFDGLLSANSPTLI
jgi:polyhydroxyalkanoate synthesis regulator phasin